MGLSIVGGDSSSGQTMGLSTVGGGTAAQAKQWV